MQVLKKQMVHRVVLLLIVAVAFGSGTLFGGVVQARAAEDAPSGFEIFWQAWGIIQDHFVDRAILDSKTLTYGAIEGLVRALGDEGHTTFLTAE
ncbi:MAG: hypothetical protein KDE53_07170, partial [Caldilineaceae bacterium]|nr:hypothetical protein [Caldilineaceae bacterium]